MKVTRFGIWGLVFGALFACQSTGPKIANPEYLSTSHLTYQSADVLSTCCEAKGKEIAIASGGRHSSKAGLEIYRSGGNIVDAAIATAFCLAVEVPQGTGLGGGGFMTLHLAKQAKQDVFVDFRETAPHRAQTDMYLDKKGEVIPSLSLVGALAVATPGFVAGLYEVHRRWGKLPWKQVLRPAIVLASEGFPAYPSIVEDITDNIDALRKDSSLKAIFLNKKGDPLKAGDKIIQKDLAETLTRISEEGRSAFYTGPIAKKIAQFVRSQGGILDLEDLEHYEIKLREPVHGSWEGHSFVSAPPPSAGGVILVEALQTLGFWSLDKIVSNPVQHYHLLAEVMKRSFANRSQYIGDPDFVQTGYERLLSIDHAKKLHEEISLDKATPANQVKPAVLTSKNDRHTTQLSLIDAAGNAISSTITVNGVFASLRMVPGTGILLNNEMDDFSSKPGVKNLFGLTGGTANSIEPNKRPVSSMSPTIFLKDGQPVLAVGAAGGSRIISTVLQIALNDLMATRGDLRAAVFARRIHHQWIPDKLDIEGKLSDESKKALEDRGHTVSTPPFSGVAQAVHRSNDGSLVSVTDPRDEGGAVAY